MFELVLIIDRTFPDLSGLSFVLVTFLYSHTALILGYQKYRDFPTGYIYIVNKQLNDTMKTKIRQNSL